MVSDSQVKAHRPEGRRNLTLRVLTIAFCMALSAWSARAAACSCIDEGVAAGIDWPKDGATDLPLDTTLVVFTYHDDASSVTPVLTRVADGIEIPLKRERRFLGNKCDGSTDILRPVRPLAANEAYTLSFRFETPDPENVPTPLPTRTFSTGTVATTPAPAIEVGLSYHRVLASPECVPTRAPPRYGPCDDFAEVDFSLMAPVSKLPLWVSLSQGVRKAITLFRTEERLPYLPAFGMKVDAGDPCLDVEVVDASGRTIRQEKLCEPEKCVVLALDQMLGGTTCTTDHDALGDMLWAQVADGTCDSPPELSIDREGGVPVYELTKAKKKTESGFTLSVRPRSHGAWSLLLVSAAVFALRRRKSVSETRRAALPRLSLPKVREL